MKRLIQGLLLWLLAASAGAQTVTIGPMSGGGGVSQGGAAPGCTAYSAVYITSSGTIACGGSPLPTFNAGVWTLGSASGTTGKIKLFHASHAFFNLFQQSASQGASITYTLPVDDGTSGEALITDGAGVLDWSTAPVADGSITLAKLANLAQDQFIGRTTASTGVPETATITAAARTVLDDTTVSAMVDTLGGASATGTGGLVRILSPTIGTGTTGTAVGATITNGTSTGNSLDILDNATKVLSVADGGKVGFQNGTTSPVRDIDIGAGTSRTIGVAHATNVLAGDSLTINAGGAYDAGAPGGTFNALSQTTRNWGEMAATPSGNIYAIVDGGDIYMQTAGAGTFNALSQTSRVWRAMAAAPNGNVYAAVNAGDIYMQTAGAGDFNALSQTTRNWTGMAAAPNGNVYASVLAGDIYMQTAGAGTFNALSQTTRNWRSMAAAPNGNVYAVVENGDIYMQTAGAGDFNALSQTSRVWYGMAAAPNGNVYAAVFAGDIYMQTGDGGTSDLAGGTLNLQAGQGKGTGASVISFKTSTPTTTGPTLQVVEEKLSISGNGSLNFRRTVTAGGTTGAQTIDRAVGTVNFAIAATTLVVTNSLVNTSSIVFATRRTNDATCFIASVESGSGSFTIRMTAACTAETSVGFLVTN